MSNTPPVSGGPSTPDGPPHKRGADSGSHKRPADGPATEGLPSRPSPLPPPREVPRGGNADYTTVVPERGARQAPPRPPLTRPAVTPRSRRARLTLRRVDPWSVFVTTLLLSLFLAVMTIVASIVLFTLLSALGVPDRINSTVSDVNGGGPLLTMGRFIGFGSLIAAANVVLITLLTTIGAMLYNLSTNLTGGLEVTLAERD